MVSEFVKLQIPGAADQEGSSPQCIHTPDETEVKKTGAYLDPLDVIIESSCHREINSALNKSVEI